ncbi:hypothetical protein EU527_04030 [Candidatus Thorarchaeota archaeon]|nr:MAG: hypothetical protein EU527_04030 [Candidatus Thorarchaeota archaeon]
MSDEILARKYEFFSWQGFIVGALLLLVSFIVQSIVSFPQVWQERLLDYVLFLSVSSLVVGLASGSVLVYLYPPDQDVIGIAGLGSDDATQHLSLILVIIALLQPILTGFIFFYEYFGIDPFIFIWVLLGFAAPSVGLTVSMFERSKEIASDLEIYFEHNSKLDMAGLEWLHAIGPRTATYRMGMLESAANRVDGIKISGHEIIKESNQFTVNV